MTKISEFFIWCSGANLSTVRRCPSERSKYVGIGGTVLFTGIFAALSGGYAIDTIFDNYLYAILFGLLWGLMIFNLDRYIVSSIKKEKKKSKEFLFALPRIILAVFLSLVIAKPLELKIFEKEIEVELESIQLEKKQQLEQKIRISYDSIIATYEKKVKTNQQQLHLQADKRDALMLRAQREADGTGGSGQRNAGPIYKLKKADADKANQEYLDNKKGIDSLNLTYQSEISLLEKEKKNNLKEVNTSQYNGIAARLHALSELSTSNHAIAIANIFIILLFIALETAPIFVKIISHRGPYDDIIQAHEHKFLVHRAEKITSANFTAKKSGSKLDAAENDYLISELENALK